MPKNDAWNLRYLQKSTPWDFATAHPELENIFLQYVPLESRILEVGCGTGANSIFLNKIGYTVTAVDVAEEAIRLARAKASTVNFKVLNFLTDAESLDRFDAIIDCAVLPVLTSHEREIFVKNIADKCLANGVWINISCSKDESHAIEQATGVQAPPFLTASKIINLAEPFFELLEMRRCIFTIQRKDLCVDFNAWVSVFKRRIH